MQPETWKPPTATVTPRCAKLAANVERPRKLIRLNADQRDESAVGQDALGNARDVDDRVALVVGFDLDIHVGAENALLRAFRSRP